MSDHSALGTASWTEASGGRLRPDERRELLAPLARGLLITTVGLTRLALRKHPGAARRSTSHCSPRRTLR